MSAVLERAILEPDTQADPPAILLERAHSHAAMGLLNSARAACATLIRDDLMALAGDDTRLKRLIEALLLARAPEQLARLLRAIGGTEVAIVEVQPAAPVGARSLLFGHEAGRLAIYVDFGALARSDRLRLAARWSHEMLCALRL